MLTDVMRETTGLLDRRFLLNALLPTLFTLGLLGTVVASTLTDPATALRAWNTLDGTIKVLAGTGAVVVAVLIAAIVSGAARSQARPAARVRTRRGGLSSRPGGRSADPAGQYPAFRREPPV
ncbi:hypothetical protein [Amycolatopsis sp. NPDC049868]|uniref:hypothetical protein n=1 Tax=Amycolatopsis sp. NPDC049868 TaxID=3363934 RepID=UPI00378A1C68